MFSRSRRVAQGMAMMLGLLLALCSSPVQSESRAIDELRDAVRTSALRWEESLELSEYSLLMGYALVALDAEYRRAEDRAPAITIVFGTDETHWVLVRMCVFDMGVSFEGQLISLEPDPRFYLSSLVPDPDIAVSSVLHRKQLALVDRYVEGELVVEEMLSLLERAADLVGAHEKDIGVGRARKHRYWLDVAIGDKRVDTLWWGDECDPPLGGLADMILAMAGLDRNELLRRFNRPIPDCQ